MHPAPSVILFTVLSGMGFGLLAFLGLGAAQPLGLAAFLLWGLGYALAVGGLLASTFHLGNPQRALKAFTQWRTSWLSREGWTSVLTLLLLAPVALAAIFGGLLPPMFGATGAAMALLTVYCTSMIYAQLRTVPRWNHWTTPALFMCFEKRKQQANAEVKPVKHHIGRNRHRQQNRPDGRQINHHCRLHALACLPAPARASGPPFVSAPLAGRVRGPAARGP